MTSATVAAQPTATPMARLLLPGRGAVAPRPLSVLRAARPGRQPGAPATRDAAPLPAAAAAPRADPLPTSASLPAVSAGPLPDLPDPAVLHYDFLVLGSGIAGLTFALKAARHGRVAVVTKGALSEACTTYAQGGVCAVLDRHDSWQAHAHDTLVAGAHLNHPPAVEVVCREGAERVLELAAWGAAFTRDGATGALHLTREGGHSHRRVVHAADATGAEIMRALEALARVDPNIDVYEHHHAVDLVAGEAEGTRQCLGADCLGPPRRGGARPSRVRFLARATMLATGGAGQVYPVTTNPATVTGDGIAMAFRAGAPVANMEFVQFHPTALWSDEPGDEGRAFLITEAVRGEGGFLLDWSGARFMPKYDTRAELAPRDIVARAIYTEMQKSGKPHVWLSIAHMGAEFVREHFPTIYAKCLERGIDITRDPIPVVPAQHYLCGGVQTSLLGETALPGLFACGEVAHTGLHGANRLASNSLLEGLVFAHRAVEPAAAHADFVARFGRQAMAQAEREALTGAPWEPAGAAGAPPAGGLEDGADAGAWVEAQAARLRSALWGGAGIVRDAEGLSRCRGVALEVLALARDALARRGPSRALSELVNLATVADLISWSALSRHESRGGHFRRDRPECLPGDPAPTVVSLRVSAGRARRPEDAAEAARGPSVDSIEKLRPPAPVPVRTGITRRERRRPDAPTVAPAASPRGRPRPSKAAPGESARKRERAREVVPNASATDLE